MNTSVGFNRIETANGCIVEFSKPFIVMVKYQRHTNEMDWDTFGLSFLSPGGRIKNIEEANFQDVLSTIVHHFWCIYHQNQGRHSRVVHYKEVEKIDWFNEHIKSHNFDKIDRWISP